MRKFRTLDGRTVPDEEILDQVRGIVFEHWKRASVIEYGDFVEVHLLEAPYAKLRKKELVIEDLEEAGFDVDEHSGPWKVNVRVPDESVS